MIEPITVLEEPKFDKWRETRITWEERLGESSRTLDVETYTTAEELVQLVRELTGGGR